MKSISLRNLHERIGAWVRKALKLGAIIVTEPGNPLMRPVAVSDARPVKPYRIRRLRPGYARLRGKLGRETDTTAIISEHRERAAPSRGDARADPVHLEVDVDAVGHGLGSTIEAQDGTMLGYRHRQSRKLRWEAPDEDITYGADALDRAVVAKDQIRLIAQTFRDRLFTDLFPGRTEVPRRDAVCASSSRRS